MKFQFKSIRKSLRSLLLIVLAMLTFSGSVVLNPKIITQVALNQPIELVESASASVAEQLPWDAGVQLNLSRTNHGSYYAMDFAAGSRTGIKARAGLSGVVINDPTVADNTSGGNCGYGNFVRIKYDDNTFAIYAHLATTPVVKINQRVNQGDVLGEIGTTGCSTGIHLHYERRFSGNVQSFTGTFVPSFDSVGQVVAGSNYTSNNSGVVNPPPVAAVTSIAFTRFADFNRDGTDDIFWRNSATGQNSVWRMSNGIDTSRVDLPTINVTDGWQVAGFGDFNKDGVGDIFWRNSVTGQNSIWVMNLSGSVSQYANLPSIGASDPWKLVGFGDFNGDRITDIMWRNFSNGQNSIWVMASPTTFINQTNFGAVGDNNWKIKPMF